MTLGCGFGNVVEWMLCKAYILERGVVGSSFMILSLRSSLVRGSPVVGWKREPMVSRWRRVHSGRRRVRSLKKPFLKRGKALKKSGSLILVLTVSKSIEILSFQKFTKADLKKVALGGMEARMFFLSR